MTYTQNYQLPQWVKSDRIMMDDFNDANSKIDAALKSHDDSLADLETALTGGLAAKGNCQIYLASYTGTGTYGETSPNTLTFPAAPVLVMVIGGGAPVVGGNSQGTAFAIRNGTLFVTGIGSSTFRFSGYSEDFAKTVTQGTSFVTEAGTATENWAGETVTITFTLSATESALTITYNEA